MGSSQPLGLAEHAGPGWLINETRCAEARVPVVVSEMMERALRKGTTCCAIRLEGDGNIEAGARRLAPAARDDSSSRTRGCAHRAFVRMTREKLDCTTWCRGVV